MQLKKICHSCQAEPGEQTCPKCGRLTGKNCWQGKLCNTCAQGIR